MTDAENNQAAGHDGIYEFTMHYSERELTTMVEKKGDRLRVEIDNNMTAELEVNWDGAITQISGNPLPESSISYIKKHVLGLDK